MDRSPSTIAKNAAAFPRDNVTTDDMDTTTLVSPQQVEEEDSYDEDYAFFDFPSVWAHAVNSMQKLEAAMADPSITSIECDVMMSSSSSSPTDDTDDDDDSDVDSDVDNTIGFPILAHPPNRESDLALTTLLHFVTQQQEGTGSDSFEKEVEESSYLIRHLKLDFKELRAVQPALEELEKLYLNICSSNHRHINPHQKTLILNADILPGPGKREEDPSMVPANEFLSTCLEYIEQETAHRQTDKDDEEDNSNKDVSFALSLGYRCDYTHPEGYLKSDAAAMKDIVERYQLGTKVNTFGMTLALNARLLGRNLTAFDDFLNDYPSSNILAWTGSGEPPIPLNEVRAIRSHYIANGTQHRIAFDCCILEKA